MTQIKRAPRTAARYLPRKISASCEFGLLGARTDAPLCGARPCPRRPWLPLCRGREVTPWGGLRPKGSGWLLPPGICGGRSFQRKDFAFVIHCCPLLLPLLSSLCRDRVRAGSEEASPLPALRLLVTDSLEIPKTPQITCFVTTLDLLFAEGRAGGKATVTLRRGALPPVGLREQGARLKNKLSGESRSSFRGA